MKFTVTFYPTEKCEGTITSLCKTNTYSDDVEGTRIDQSFQIVTKDFPMPIDMYLRKEILLSK